MLYWNRFPLPLLWVLCSIISVCNTVSTSLGLNQNGISKTCGHLCSYIDQCNFGHYENSIFMQSLCDFMTREISYLNDETEVLKIAARYMHNLHKYDIERYVARKKRSSKRKVIADVFISSS